MRQAEIVIKMGGNWALIWDTRTTPRIVQSQEKAQSLGLIGKVNNIVKALKLNVKQRNF